MIGSLGGTRPTRAAALVRSGERVNGPRRERRGGGDGVTRGDVRAAEGRQVERLVARPTSATAASSRPYPAGRPVDDPLVNPPTTDLTGLPPMRTDSPEVPACRAPAGVGYSVTGAFGRDHAFVPEPDARPRAVPAPPPDRTGHCEVGRSHRLERTSSSPSKHHRTACSSAIRRPNTCRTSPSATTRRTGSAFSSRTSRQGRRSPTSPSRRARVGTAPRHGPAVVRRPDPLSIVDSTLRTPSGGG